jgi:nucleoside-diphosphate-sugar epimerase
MALVAVTGATGFVGQALVPCLLAAGHRVRILARQLPEFAVGSAGPVELVLGDLSQAAALERLVAGVDVIFHLAGLIKAREAEEFFTVNRDGVANLLAAIDAPARPRFILLSSLAAREPALSPYAASKRAGEEALRQRGFGLAWLALRAPVVYGPGDRETLAFFKAAQKGFAPVAGDGSGRISAIHVSDVAELLCRLAEGELPPADAYGAEAGHDPGCGDRAGASRSRREPANLIPRKSAGDEPPGLGGARPPAGGIPGLEGRNRAGTGLRPNRRLVSAQTLAVMGV